MPRVLSMSSRMAGSMFHEVAANLQKFMDNHSLPQSFDPNRITHTLTNCVYDKTLSHKD